MSDHMRHGGRGRRTDAIELKVTMVDKNEPWREQAEQQTDSPVVDRLLVKSCCRSESSSVEHEQVEHQHQHLANRYLLPLLDPHPRLRCRCLIT